MSIKVAQITLNNGKTIKLNLDETCAPVSVANFVKLAESGFFSGLIFHRVIKNFMVQGGGFDVDMNQKKAATIKGEFASNGVVNDRKHKAGTISMARTMINDSASSQFFICSVDTPHLDGSYAAFGEVADAESLAVVIDMGNVATGTCHGHGDVPRTPIIIDSVVML